MAVALHPTVQLLRPELVAKLRSTPAIPTLAQAVVECVANSLDAKATRIHVSVDINELSFTVQDDGCGIDPASLGLLGVRHMTSKLRTVAEFEAGMTSLGFKGEALSSIAEVSVLQITSRAQGSFETHVKLLRGGKAMQQGLSITQRSQTGTTVIVRNFLHNQPVRQKQVSKPREMENIKNLLWLLAFPFTQVDIILEELSTKQCFLSLPKGRSIHAGVQELFWADTGALMRVCAHQTSYELEGYFLQPPTSFPSRDKQVMYVNNRSVRSSQMHAVLDHLYGKVLQALQDDANDQGEMRDASNRRRRHAAFVLFITCPPSQYDITLEPNKSSILFSDARTIQHLLEDAARQAWGRFVPASLLPKPQLPAAHESMSWLAECSSPTLSQPCAITERTIPSPRQDAKKRSRSNADRSTPPTPSGKVSKQHRRLGVGLESLQAQACSSQALSSRRRALASVVGDLQNQQTQACKATDTTCASPKPSTGKNPNARGAATNLHAMSGDRSLASADDLYLDPDAPDTLPAFADPYHLNPAYLAGRMPALAVDPLLSSPPASLRLLSCQNWLLAELQDLPAHHDVGQQARLRDCGKRQMHAAVNCSRPDNDSMFDDVGLDCLAQELEQQSPDLPKMPTSSSNAWHSPNMSDWDAAMDVATPLPAGLQTNALEAFSPHQQDGSPQGAQDTDSPFGRQPSASPFNDWQPGVNDTACKWNCSPGAGECSWGMLSPSHDASIAHKAACSLSTIHPSDNLQLFKQLNSVPASHAGSPCAGATISSDVSLCNWGTGDMDWSNIGCPPSSSPHLFRSPPSTATRNLQPAPGDASNAWTSPAASGDIGSMTSDTCRKLNFGTPAQTANTPPGLLGRLREQLGKGRLPGVMTAPPHARKLFRGVHSNPSASLMSTAHHASAGVTTASHRSTVSGVLSQRRTVATPDHASPDAAAVSAVPADSSMRIKQPHSSVSGAAGIRCGTCAAADARSPHASLFLPRSSMPAFFKAAKPAQPPAQHACTAAPAGGVPAHAFGLAASADATHQPDGGTSSHRCNITSSTAPSPNLDVITSSPTAAACPASPPALTGGSAATGTTKPSILRNSRTPAQPGRTPKRVRFLDAHQARDAPLEATPVDAGSRLETKASLAEHCVTATCDSGDGRNGAMRTTPAEMPAAYQSAAASVAPEGGAASPSSPVPNLPCSAAVTCRAGQDVAPQSMPTTLAATQSPIPLIGFAAMQQSAVVNHVPVVASIEIGQPAAVAHAVAASECTIIDVAAPVDCVAQPPEHSHRAPQELLSSQHDTADKQRPHHLISIFSDSEDGSDESDDSGQAHAPAVSRHDAPACAAMPSPTVVATAGQDVAAAPHPSDGFVPHATNADRGETLDASNSVEELFRKWRNSAEAAKSCAPVVDVTELGQLGPLGTLVPGAITRQALDCARFLKQVDNKFLLLVCGDVLVAMDQHAADERVRLESLQELLERPEGRLQHCVSHQLPAAQEVHLSSKEQAALQAYADRVWQWGWRWQFNPTTETASITHSPKVLDTVMASVDLKLYLHQLEETSGAQLLPPGVLRVLRSKACRGAIMFGDPLDASQCCELLSSLQRTQLWSCCAHGRPTTAPLVDLRALRGACERAGQGVALLGDARGAARVSASRLRGLLRGRSVCAG